MVGNLSANTYRETQPVGADSTYKAIVWNRELRSSRACL